MNTTTARERLEAVLNAIAAGAGGFHFALLRPSPLDGGLIDQGDADLLGTRDSAAALLRLLLQRSVVGDIHFRVTCSKPEKLQVTVHSVDFAHSATYDVWLELPQIDRGRSQIRFSDVSPQLREGRGIEPLPDCLGAAVYLHHLVAKRKSLAAAHTADRIRAFAAHACDDGACRAAQWFAEVEQTGVITAQSLTESAGQIERLLNIELTDDEHRVRLRWRPRVRLESSDVVCVLGVDGVGKSTLIENLVGDGTVAAESLVGKKLYRRSLIYRLATRGARHRDPAAREAIDERLAPVLFLRSVSAFRRTIAWRRLRSLGTLLVDRCPLDFLYVGRKSDAGHFHPATARLESLAPATRTIQLVAPHDVTAARKPELTEAGHAAYDEAMLLRLAFRCPSDHLVFHNGGNVADSTRALGRYLGGVLKTQGRRRAA